MVGSSTNIVGNHKRYNDYAGFFRNNFGERVQKISIHAGFTCPNRDGSLATGGCTYCNNKSFQPGYCHPSKFHFFSLEAYLDIMIRMVEKLPPDMIIERIAGESKPDLLVAGGWGIRTDQVMKRFEEKLKQQNTWQGKYYQCK